MKLDLPPVLDQPAWENPGFVASGRVPPSCCLRQLNRGSVAD
jgi:hypothetical protein